MGSFSRQEINKILFLFFLKNRIWNVKCHFTGNIRTKSLFFFHSQQWLMIGMPFNFQLRMIDYWLLEVLENTLCLKMQYTTEKEFNSFWQNHFNSCKKEIYFQWICGSVCASRNLISLCFLDEEAVDIIERVVKTDQTVLTYRLIWIFTKHTEFVEITMFQTIQFAQLQKVNIHILGYNHFFFLISYQTYYTVLHQ